jgi:hypothetical protein
VASLAGCHHAKCNVARGYVVDNDPQQTPLN